MRNGRMRRITELYEQGASNERVWAYLRRWLRWAGTTCCWALMIYGCAMEIYVKHNLGPNKCMETGRIRTTRNTGLFDFAGDLYLIIVSIDDKRVQSNFRHYLDTYELLPGDHKIEVKYMFANLFVQRHSNSNLTIIINVKEGMLYELYPKNIINNIEVIEVDYKLIGSDCRNKYKYEFD